MKASLEYALMFLFGTLLVSLMLQFAAAITKIHQGHLYLNYITHLTENYDGNLFDVTKHAAEQSICTNCSFTHSKLGNHVEIEVIFPVQIPVIGFKSQMRIHGMTQAFE